MKHADLSLHFISSRYKSAIQTAAAAATTTTTAKRVAKKRDERGEKLIYLYTFMNNEILITASAAISKKAIAPYHILKRHLYACPRVRRRGPILLLRAETAIDNVYNAISNVAIGI